MQNPPFLKLGVGYPFFIFGIIRDQHASILLCTDNFSGAPYEIRLNPKLFHCLHKANTLRRKGYEDPASSDDSTSTPSPVPSPVNPCLGSPLLMDMSLVAHLTPELRVL